jgi:hypothetical protein
MPLCYEVPNTPILTFSVFLFGYSSSETSTEVTRSSVSSSLLSILYGAGLFENVIIFLFFRIDTVGEVPCFNLKVEFACAILSLSGL